MDLPTLDDRPARDDPADGPDEVLAPHRAALQALDDPSTNPLVAVTWLAAHLAATEECLYGLARRRLPDGATAVHQQVAVDRRLHEALWRLDRRLTGDVHHAHHDVDDLERAVRARLEEHASGEQRLLSRLLSVLDDEERADLSRHMASALEHAPTRPHPHAPHPLWAGGALHRLEALADRLRDLMDGRDIPTPHVVRPPREAGPWACYVMGLPIPDDAEAAQTPGAAPPAAGADAPGERVQRHPRDDSWSGTCGP